MRFLISLFTISSLLAVSGCQDSGKTTNKNEQEIRDNAKLEAELKPLVGTYVGDVSNPSVGADPFPVQINIFLVKEQSGVNEDGEPKYRPALHGIYRRLDFPSDMTNEKSLVIRYYPETGEIVLGTATEGSGTADSRFLSISGKFSNGQITGEIANHRNVLGILKVERTNP